MSADTASNLDHLLTAKGLHEFVAFHSGMPEEEAARICRAGAPWPLGGLPENPVVHEVLTAPQVTHLTSFFGREPWAEGRPVPSGQGEEGSRRGDLLPVIDRILSEERVQHPSMAAGEGAFPTTHEPHDLLALSRHFEQVAAATGVDVETVVRLAKGLLAYSLRVWDLVLEQWPADEAGDEG